MRPLLVLFIVLAAVAVFVATMLQRGDDRAPVTISPPPLEQPSTMPSKANLASPEAEPSIETASPQEEPREAATQSAGAYTNALVGRVIDARGEPVSGAEVLLSTEPMMGEFLADVFFGVDSQTEQAARAEPISKTTGQEGRFSFRSVDPRPDYYVIVRHKDFTMAQEHPVFVGEEGEFPSPDIVLSRGSMLKGFVSDVGGNPIAGATVHTDSAYMLGEEIMSPDRLSAKTDASGYFEMSNVPGGARNVMAEAEEFGVQIRHNIMFSGTEDDQQQVDFRLDFGKSITGRVVGPDGAGIPAVAIRALNYGNSTSSRGSGLSDDTGAFELKNLQPGSYMLHAQVQGFRQIVGRGNRCQAGDTDVEIKMVGQALVRGNVVSAVTGAPVTEFTCKVQFVDENSTIFEDTGVNERFKGRSDGSFELTGLDPGTYVIQASSKDLAPTISEPFTITTEDSQVSGIVIRISAGATLKGRVVDAEGKPVAGALVTTHDNRHVENLFHDMLGTMLSSNATKQKARTDGEGYFVLQQLAPESYQIQVAHDDFTKHSKRNIQLGDGQELDLGDLVMTAGGTIRGTVRDEAGQALARAQIMLQNEDGFTSYTARTDGQGRYTFLHVRAGSYKLSATRVPPGSSGDVFTAILDQKNSEVAISVYDGGEVSQDLHLGE
jgi:protocatechuate 3,4-dioxygenase beta subunit